MPVQPTAKAADRDRDQHWLKSVMSGGTLGDRQAALVLQLQEACIHRVDMLSSLLTMAAKKSKREALMALGKLAKLASLCLLRTPNLLGLLGLFSKRSLILIMIPSPRLAVRGMVHSPASPEAQAHLAGAAAAVRAAGVWPGKAQRQSTGPCGTYVVLRGSPAEKLPHLRPVTPRACARQPDASAQQSAKQHFYAAERIPRAGEGRSVDVGGPSYLRLGSTALSMH